eukprot:TRINITY_DN3772_c1_g1_i2.p1 TRINITY_DN3772_c1_g1~~TRINITY_DN3772_c1_g1_i2.p1  ORF type:complete len:485 (+),score=91.67 TRINITY_DN3772_c1_g1_i2:175-1455(+)
MQELAAKYSVTPSTISRICSKRDQIFSAGIERQGRRSLKRSPYEAVTVRMMDLSQLLSCLSYPSTDSDLKQLSMHIAQDEEIPDFTASNGYIHRFKEIRSNAGIRLERIVDRQADSLTQNNMVAIDSMLRRTSMSSQNVYIAYETFLCYADLPDYGVSSELIRTNSPADKILVILCHNLYGVRMPPFIIYDEGSYLGSLEGDENLQRYLYKAERAIFRSDMFLEWLKRMNEDVQEPSVILLSDELHHQIDTSAHQLGKIKLAHIRASLMKQLHPCAESLASVAKIKYRAELVSYLRHVWDEASGSQVDRVYMKEFLTKKFDLSVGLAAKILHRAWESIPNQFFQACWRRNRHLRDLFMTLDVEANYSPIIVIYDAVKALKDSINHLQMLSTVDNTEHIRYLAHAHEKEQLAREYAHSEFVVSGVPN